MALFIDGGGAYNGRMMENTAHVPLPDLAFREGMPVSTAFDDVYFSRAGGVAETKHVFLAGNGLPERFAEKPDFTIAELGFGTGLNFLVTWQEFLRAAPAGHRLHYIAIEKFPLTLELLKQVLALQPELAETSKKLLASYPLRLPGWHRLHFGQVTLTLGFGEAATLLSELEIKVDAWFLDGFSPAKNPAMWEEEVLQNLNKLSSDGATVATFTAAGAVKRGLQAQGFDIQKRPGYGHKREMLMGQRISQALAVIQSKVESLDPVLILGGGLAGCMLAYALAERGHAVVLLERGKIAGGASGNQAAVLFPQLTKRWTASAAWYFAGYDFMRREMKRLAQEGLAFSFGQPGMLRLPRHAEEEAQLRGLNATLGLDSSIVQWIDREDASARAGVDLATGGAWFAEGMWINPSELCHVLLQHPHITYKEETEVVSCRREENQWHITTVTGETYRAAHCCITAARDTALLAPDYGLRLNGVAGQVTVVDARAVASPLKTILCHRGYVIPCGEDYLLGATYRHNDETLQVTEADHQANLVEVESFLPGWVQGAVPGGRVSQRATTPDRLPYVGQLAEGLYISAGHGSRGMLSAPLAAEAIASMICGEQVPLSPVLRAAVNPLRFHKKQP